MDWGIGALNDVKFRRAADAIRDSGGGFWRPLAVFVGTSAGFGAVAGALVSFVSPLAAGSGIAEIKTYLNGIHIRGLLTVRWREREGEREGESERDGEGGREWIKKKHIETFPARASLWVSRGRAPGLPSQSREELGVACTARARPPNARLCSRARAALQRVGRRGASSPPEHPWRRAAEMNKERDTGNFVFVFWHKRFVFSFPFSITFFFPQPQ